MNPELLKCITPRDLVNPHMRINLKYWVGSQGWKDMGGRDSETICPKTLIVKTKSNLNFSCQTMGYMDMKILPVITLCYKARYI